MRVQIRDKEVLESLTPENLRAYLESQGWGNERPWGQWGKILSKEQKGKLWEIVIPLRDEGYGYAEFMGLMVATLAEAEDRSQLDVFYDLADPTAGAEATDNRKGGKPILSVWCVRADYGKYTDDMVNGGYIGYGGNWPDLSDAKDLHEISERLARTAFREETSKPKIAAYAGMMATFLWKIQPGDWVITPYGKYTPHRSDSDGLRYGQMLTGSSQYVPAGSDACPYTMRRKIAWAEQSLQRDSLSEPLRRTLNRAAKSVFHVKQRADFLASIGLRDEQPTV